MTCETTLREAIARLEERKEDTNRYIEQRLLETGRGDLVSEGYIWGINDGVRILKEMLEEKCNAS